MLFTCSDDASVIAYHTSDCHRLRVFQIGDACKSIDLTKDAKVLVASSTTNGLIFFDVESGKKIGTVKVPSIQTKYVEFSFSDKQVLVVSEDRGKSTVRIYSTEQCIPGSLDTGNEVEPITEFQGPADHMIT